MPAIKIQPLNSAPPAVPCAVSAVAISAAGGLISTRGVVNSRACWQECGSVTARAHTCEPLLPCAFLV